MVLRYLNLPLCSVVFPMARDEEPLGNAPWLASLKTLEAAACKTLGIPSNLVGEQLGKTQAQRAQVPAEAQE